MSGTSMVGLVVVIIGAALLIGNVTRIFPTFPFAGAIVIAVGGAIMRAGSR